MTSEERETMSQTELSRVVIKFTGDSGDGMQLTGNQYTLASAAFGNDVATLPDWPKPNIRATKRKVALNILYNITVLLTYSSPVHTFFAEGYSFKPQAAAEPPYPAQIAHRGLYAG